MTKKYELVLEDKFAPMHTHSLEEMNLGILYPGKRCEKCGPENGRAMKVTKVNRETGTITVRGEGS